MARSNHACDGLNLYGLLADAEDLLAEPWLERVLQIEESERQHRSLKRRLGNARLGAGQLARNDCLESHNGQQPYPHRYRA